MEYLFRGLGVYAEKGCMVVWIDSSDIVRIFGIFASSMITPMESVNNPAYAEQVRPCVNLQTLSGAIGQLLPQVSNYTASIVVEEKGHGPEELPQR